MALLDLVPPALDLIPDHGGFFDEEGGAREEIEESTGGASDAGEELPAGKNSNAAGSDGFFDEVRIAGGLDALAAEAGVDGGEEALGDGGFGEGQQQGLIEGRGGALGIGIEFADGLDLVAEELEADGAVGFGRIDVEDAAAEGDLAGHLDHVDAGVADAGEVVDQHVGTYSFAALEDVARGRHSGRGEKLHAGGFDGRDDEAASPVAIFQRVVGARLLDFGVGREIFEGQHVVGGKAEDAVDWDGAGELAGGEEGGVQGLGGFVVGDNNNRGNLRGASEEGNVKGAGRGGESGDTTTPTGKCQVSPCLFEGGRMLQVRQQLADKGEDHAVFSLAVLQNGETGRVMATAGILNCPGIEAKIEECPTRRRSIVFMPGWVSCMRRRASRDGSFGWKRCALWWRR